MSVTEVSGLFECML